MVYQLIFGFLLVSVVLLTLFTIRLTNQLKIVKKEENEIGQRLTAVIHEGEILEKKLAEFRESNWNAYEHVERAVRAE
jgi:hypothetical protein